MFQQKKLMVALDTPQKEKFDSLLDQLEGQVEWIKIGMEAYYALGPYTLGKAQSKGFKIFLDLKLHDIPNTTSRALRALLLRGVDMINVHAAGGYSMLKSCVDVVNELYDSKLIEKKPLLIAVTQLTSISQETMTHELLVQGEIADVVLHYANMAKKAGLNGIVCSAHEVPTIKEKLGDHFVCVTPGVRPKGVGSQDQKRVVTPQEAVRFGSDYLVVGRPITEAKDILVALNQVKREMKR